MADFEICLPNLREVSGDEEAGDEATVSFVYLEEGDAVKEGDDLIEMVTDKATFNVPCPVGGKLVEVLTEDGATVKVGDTMAVLETED